MSPRNDAEIKFVNNIAHWMYHFTSSVETIAEENHSMSKLNGYISDCMTSSNPITKISKDLGRRTTVFVQSSFYPRLSKLTFRHFMKIPEGDRADNSWTESQNSALKRDVAGPKPHQKIAGMFVAIPTKFVTLSHPCLP